MSTTHHQNCELRHKECEVYTHSIWMNGDTKKLIKKPVQIHRSMYRRAHVYTVIGDPRVPYGTQMISVTTIGNELSGSPEGLLYWASGLAAATGNPNEYKEDRRRSAESGSELHSDIENYISNGTINEMNPMFLSWYKHIGEKEKFVDTEIMLYSALDTEKFSENLYGGTADALSISDGSDHVLWDWKTKKASSYDGKPIMKDWVQISAYWNALKSMNSIYQPDCARIAYIMRDTNEVDIVTIDREELEMSLSLFNQAVNTRILKGAFNKSVRNRKEG